MLLSCQHHRAACTLDKWVNVLLEIDSAPIVKLQVEVEHLVCKLSIFELATVNDHGLAKDGGLVVFSWQDVDSFGSDHIVSFFYCVEIGHLVGAFTNLSFSVEHEATTEGENLIVKRA